MRRLFFLFSAITLVAAALAFSVAVLIVASFFLAERPAPSGFLVHHLVVAALFLILGCLMGGITYHATGVARAVVTVADLTDGHLARHLSRMTVLLMASGAGLLGILGLILFAVLSRINEGYAVFG